MINLFSEKITFPASTKNAGFILVKNNGVVHNNILADAINKFYAGFGNKIFVGGNKRYIYAILLPEHIFKLDIFSLWYKDDDFVFIEGTFYDKDLLNINNKKDQNVNASFSNNIYNNIKKGHVDILKELNGHYSGFAYLHSEGLLYCFNDRFGVNKLFFYNDEKTSTFVLSNNLFAISTNKFLEIRVRDRSIGQILLIKYPLGRNTEFKNIFNVLPSDILIYSNRNKIKFKKLFVHFYRENKFTKKQYLKNLYDRFSYFFNYLKTYLDEPIGIFLSKGKDSRIILYFLEHLNFDYKLFNFSMEGGEYDHTYVTQLAQLLGKDLYVLKDYYGNIFESHMLSMNTSNINSWYALSQLASRYVNYVLIGTLGDPWSGKLDTFRSFPLLQTVNDLANKEFLAFSEGVKEQDVKNCVKFYKKLTNIKDEFMSSFKEYENSQLYNIELLYNIDYRYFRNTLPILHKTNHNLSVIHPYLERNIANEYFNLPHNLINTQYAHAYLANLEKRSNKIRSTEFPIPLKIEKEIRSLMIIFVKINEFLKNKPLRTKLKGNNQLYYKEYMPISSYFNGINDSDKFIINNYKLFRRLKNVDLYLYLTLDNSITKYCHRIQSIVPIGTINKETINSIKSLKNYFKMM